MRYFLVFFEDPGSPLGPADFWRAKQYGKKETNETTHRMMRAPKTLSMEEMERIGEETVKRLNREQKNILAPVAYHWPNGILFYTIDAAFSTAERAIIASGITHIEENSCIRSSLDRKYQFCIDVSGLWPGQTSTTTWTSCPEMAAATLRSPTGQAGAGWRSDCSRPAASHSTSSSTSSYTASASCTR